MLEAGDIPPVERVNMLSIEFWILKTEIDRPRAFTGESVVESHPSNNFSKNSLFLRGSRTRRNNSTSEAKQAKWPNLH